MWGWAVFDTIAPKLTEALRKSTSPAVWFACGHRAPGLGARLRKETVTLNVVASNQ